MRHWRVYWRGKRYERPRVRTVQEGLTDYFAERPGPGPFSWGALPPILVGLIVIVLGTMIAVAAFI